MSNLSDNTVAQIQTRLLRLEQLEAGERLRVTARQRTARASYAAIAFGILALPTMAVAIDLPYAFQAGGPVVAAELNENFAALASAIDALVIREDTTIQIGPMQTCAAIQQALDDLDGRSIVGTATVTIDLLPGTYACEESIVVRHRDGERIQIRGAGNTAGDVTLTFPPDSNGVSVSEGRALGSLENLTLQGAGSGSGMIVYSNAAADLSTVVITGFYYGLLATSGASVSGVEVLAIQNANDGMLAWLGSTMKLISSHAVDNGASGFAAVDGSEMRLTDCNAEGNAHNGYVGWLHATIESDGCTAINNSDGFRADQSSYVYVFDSIASNNTYHGYEALFGGHLNIAGSHTAIGNGAGETNLPLNDPNPSTGAVITG